MEEIKVGEHVRTVYGEIDKVTEIIVGRFHTTYEGKEFAKGLNRTIGNEIDIVKHSKNIIDLIEAGDIVLYKIKGLEHFNIATVEEYTEARTLKKELRVGLYSLKQIDIKKILTKEKFERGSYKVEEKVCK